MDTGKVSYNPYELPADTFAYLSLVALHPGMVQDWDLPDLSQTAAIAAIQERVDYNASMGTPVVDPRLPSGDTGGTPTFTSFAPTVDDGAGNTGLFTIYGSNMAIQSPPDSGILTEYVSLVAYILIGNYPGADYVPGLIGQTTDPPPNDLVYVSQGAGQGAGGDPTPTAIGWPSMTWAAPAPQVCYVTAVWQPADKYGSQDPNDFQITDIPGMFTFNGTSYIQIDFTVSPTTLPATGGSLTLTTTTDFTPVSDVAWNDPVSGSGGGSLNWTMTDTTHIDVTFGDWTTVGANPPLGPGSQVQVVISYSGYSSTQDIRLT